MEKFTCHFVIPSPKVTQRTTALKDPPGYHEAAAALDPPPAPAVATGEAGEGGERKKVKKTKKRKSSSSKKKAKARKVIKEAPKEDEPEETEDAILESFLQGYRPIIRSLPVSLRPSSTRHGEHSYTVYLDVDYFLDLQMFQFDIH